MDILIDPEKSAGPLALAASIAKERSSLAFLAGLVLETDGASRVRASSTDAEVSVTVSIPAQVREAGRVCVNARSFMEVVRRAEGRAVAVESGPDVVRCGLGQSRYRLGLIGDEERTAIQAGGAHPLFSMPASLLASMIAAVQPAAGADAARYILDSVLLERKGAALRAVATDGRRLAYREASLPGKGADFSFPVPSSAVRALEKAFAFVGEDAEAAVFYDGEKMEFRAGDVRVAARALEGTYPAWREAVPRDADAAFFAVDADKLRGALEGLIRIVGDPAEVRLERRNESSLRLTAEGRLNAGEEIVETADPLRSIPTLRVNGRYLLEAVQPLRGQLARLGVLRADRPLLVQSMDDVVYRALIMPILTPASEEKTPVGR